MDEVFDYIVIGAGSAGGTLAARLKYLQAVSGNRLAYLPLELRLRAAAVIISLATGPFRGQEPEWEWETLRMIASAEALVRQVG